MILKVKKIKTGIFDTPLGKLQLGASRDGIVYVTFTENDEKTAISTADFEIVEAANEHLNQIIKELSEYFDGKRTHFTVSLDLTGSDFQKTVWNQLLQIPYGNTWSYMQQSQALNNPKAIRAVAAANGKNRHAIIIPCHRVVGSKGNLTGYAGGLWRKKWLLDFERKNSGFPTQPVLF